jgi:bifunctional non-homologous end joining protein LigD
MGLELYKKMRNFKVTDEPSGAHPRRASGRPKLPSFVVQEHHASHLHYDFRLEMDGVLKSWAVPKGPSLEPGVRRLAVEVEDHPLEYASFEGEIPRGEYGAGHVKVWDAGVYASPDPLRALARGKLELELSGKRLKGRYVLVRAERDAGASKPRWFLIRRGDAGSSQRVDKDADKMFLKVDDRVLELTHLQKVFYPETGYRKKQVLNYYRKIAEVMLPHLQGRPISLRRYPDGVTGENFFEKRTPSHAPAWLHKIPMRDVDYAALGDVSSLLWAVNLATLEIHPYLAREPKLDQPTFVVFDLDPGPGTAIRECVDVALKLRARFKKLGLECFPKISGSKGLQVYVPLNTTVSFDETKPFAHAMAEAMERAHPKLVVSRMSKALRQDRVLIDWSQNDRAKTTVAVYSLRATPTPSVSTPVTWAEVIAFQKSRRAQWRFTPEQVLARIEKSGDLFAPVLELKQKLPKPEKYL